MKSHDNSAKKRVDTSIRSKQQEEEKLPNNYSDLNGFETMQHIIQNPNQETLTPNTMIQLQRTIGNQGVLQLLEQDKAQGKNNPQGKSTEFQVQRMLGISHLGSSSLMIQRVKVYNGEEIAEQEDTPSSDEWYVCWVEDISDFVYVHLNNLGMFMSAYPNANVEELEDHNQRDTKEEVRESKESYDQLSDEGSMDDIWGMKQSEEEKNLKSRQIHFVNASEEEKKRNTFNPDDGFDQFDVSNFTIDNLPGWISRVIYKVPAGQRTHYEITCIALTGEQLDLEVVIKFDFTTDGYRMIYGAEDRDDGLKALDVVDVTDKHISISDAVGMFASQGNASGAYREGANTCHTFASSFFEDLTGQKTSDTEDISLFTD